MQPRAARALLALDGLSVGDAFGQNDFISDAEAAIAERRIPSGFAPPSPPRREEGPAAQARRAQFEKMNAIAARRGRPYSSSSTSPFILPLAAATTFSAMFAGTSS